MMAPLTLDSVRAEIARLVDLPAAEVLDDANLMDLGLDSLRAMTLVERWVSAGVPVDFSELAEDPTLRHWWSVLSRHLDHA
jgi:bifunctional isochorismate lyase/aryl carrier protein